jgi:type IV pilus assembly protein PilQ
MDIMTNRPRVGSAMRFWRSLVCCFAALLVMSGAAWSADTVNKLVSVSVESDAASPTVLVETAEPVGYRYTVYDSFEPTRVVIDFPGMELAGVDETTPVNLGAVQEVRVAGFDLSSGKLARVEILLAENTDYQVKLDGKAFRVAFDSVAAQAAAASPAAEDAVASAPAATPVDASEDANVLRAVRLTPGQAVLEANGKVGKFQYFALDKPARLVVDVYGLRPAFKERSFVAEEGFRKVRIGSYSDKTRLVFDASGVSLPEHTVEAKETDILVNWGAVASPAAAAESAAAAAAAAVAEEVAEKAAAEPAPAAVTEVSAAPAPGVSAGPVTVEAIDFANEEGRSVVSVTLSGAAKVSAVQEEGKLLRFEIVDASISRALRRTIDASAFPGAVTTVTPYTVTEADHQNVRIATELKGPVGYALEQTDNTVRLVIDDGAYVEPLPPAVSQVEVVAPEAPAAGEMAAPAQLPEATSELVTAEQMAAEAARYTGEKITLVFDSANVRSILQLIGDVSGLNILASSDVQGTVTLRLIDVPWDQALDLVLETTGLGKVQQGNVLRIMPKDKIREIEAAAMKEQQIAIDEGVLVTRTFAISYASVDDMKGYLTDIKSDRGSIIADSRNKQLIVRDVEAVLGQMQNMIDQIDKPERQVMIEARIVEANTSFSRDLGINWKFGYNNQNQTSMNRDVNVDSVDTGLGGAFMLSPTAATNGFASALKISALKDALDIDLRLAALETSGEGRIISTPRVTTLNGEKATISQGTKIPFSSVSDSGTDITFENAELKLDVTPEINPDGSIILEIDASNSSVGSIVPTATGNAVSIDEKKAQTKVLVRDGQTTVIGGIFVEQENEGESGVPILKDVPVFGKLFKSTTKSRDRRELLIFITPRIVES